MDFRRVVGAIAVCAALAPAEVCAALKDPARNAGLNPDQIAGHVQADPLVRRAWAPGGIRAKPPIAHEAFVALLRTRSEVGAACPNETVFVFDSKRRNRRGALRAPWCRPLGASSVETGRAQRAPTCQASIPSKAKLL